MSEKMVSIEKIYQKFKDKFSKNYVNTLVRKMCKDGELDWCKNMPLTQDSAKKLIKRLIDNESATLKGNKCGRRNWNGIVYIKNPEDSFRKTKNGWIAEHIYKMEKKVGRKLGRNEFVYHVNGNKVDNRLENLVLCNSSREVQKVRNSIFDILQELFEEEILEFNFETKEYFIRR